MPWTPGYPKGWMANVLGLIGFGIFIACVIGLAASITWAVVKISPNPDSKKQSQAS
jgi:hypothetical protein